jgi:hypothetical protein
MHHARADAELEADLEDAVTAGLQFENSRLHPGGQPDAGRAWFRSPARAKPPYYSPDPFRCRMRTYVELSHQPQSI